MCAFDVSLACSHSVVVNDWYIIFTAFATQEMPNTSGETLLSHTKNTALSCGQVFGVAPSLSAVRKKYFQVWGKAGLLDLPQSSFRLDSVCFTALKTF